MSRRRSLVASFLALSEALAPAPLPPRGWRPPPLSPRAVDCPKCGAEAGSNCRKRKRNKYHQERREVAAGLAEMWK